MEVYSDKDFFDLLGIIDVASGLGLLVAELVTNSFKYAYAVGERGNVAVDFNQTTSGWCLEVSDQGRGLPEGFDIDQSKARQHSNLDDG